jgi:hypothetical protein
MNSRAALRQGNAVAIWRGNELLRVQQNIRSRYSVLLLAELLVSPALTPSITHLALGSGIGNGTLALPQAPSTSRPTMYNEVARVPITTIDFDDLANLEADTFSDESRTNRILVHTEVGIVDGEHLITEIALFGGNGASAANGGTIFAWSTFPVIDNRTGGDNPSAPEDLVFDWVLKLPLITVEV